MRFSGLSYLISAVLVYHHKVSRLMSGAVVSVSLMGIEATGEVVSGVAVVRWSSAWTYWLLVGLTVVLAVLIDGF